MVHMVMGNFPGFTDYQRACSLTYNFSFTSSTYKMETQELTVTKTTLNVSCYGVEKNIAERGPGQ